MWVSKVSEPIGFSPISFEEAAREAVMRANRVKVEGGRLAGYRVRLRLSSEMAPERVLHW